MSGRGTGAEEAAVVHGEVDLLLRLCVGFDASEVAFDSWWFGEALRAVGDMHVCWCVLR